MPVPSVAMLMPGPRVVPLALSVPFATSVVQFGQTFAPLVAPLALLAVPCVPLAAPCAVPFVPW